MFRFLLLALIVITISACSNQDNVKNAPEEGTVDSENTSNTVDSKEEKNDSEVIQNDNNANEEPSPIKENANEEKETKLNSNLLNYRPEVGTKKTFIQNDQYKITYSVVAENDKFIQRIIRFGDVVTLQILEWSPEYVSIVFKEENPNEVSNQLESYETYAPPETLIDINKTGKGKGEEWEVVAIEEKVKVPYKVFNNVYVVQQTLVSKDNKTIFRSYYAPGVGLIKEIYEVTGDNGYKITSELESIDSN